MTRARAVLLGLAGAALGGFVGRSASDALGMIALAIAAGFGLSLMLRGVGLRLIGIAMVLLGGLGAGLSVYAAVMEQPLARAALAGFLIVVFSGVVFVRSGPTWVALAADRPAQPKDLWKQIDEGIDPTEEEIDPTRDEEMPPGGDSR